MKLQGRFGSTSGRPYIEARLAFPRFKIGGEVSFLLDTGADSTSVMPIDGRRLGLDYSQLTGRAHTLGAGGIADTFEERAIVVLASPDRKLFVYDLPILIYPNEDELLPAPSLIGRDILNRWRVVFDRSNDFLVAEVISADFTNDSSN